MLNLCLNKFVLTLHEGKTIILNPTYHIKIEESFDPADVILLMTTGSNFFSYALMKQAPKVIIEFGYYYISKGEELNWNEFFENNDMFSKRYLQSAIAFYQAESMLVPEIYYLPEEAQLQLDGLFGKKINTIPVSEHLPEWNLYNISRDPESLSIAVKNRFVSGRSLNMNSVLLKNLSGVREDSIMIDFRTDEFSVLVLNENQLQLLRSFSYSSPEDVLYYLLKICQQTGLSQQEVKIILSGLIEKDSTIFRELYKYFIHLEFEKLPGEISIAGELAECPQHYFSSICKLATCVL
jgi:hypothetical protein